MNDDFENELLNEDDLFDDSYADQFDGQSPEESVEYLDDFNDDEFEDVKESTEGADLEEDAITLFLKDKGIDARSIKFEDANGEVNIDFNDLTPEEQLELLRYNNVNNSDYDLSNDEVELLNTIRRNNWTTNDYINYIQKQAIDNYTLNSNLGYSISDISDDELYAMDLKSQVPNITDDELAEEVENAKRNMAVYTRRVQNLRNDYSTKEQQHRAQIKAQQEAQAKQQMESFTNNVIQAINNNKYMDVGLGQDMLELSEQDMQDVADFLLGQDDAGNRYIANALNNPETLVKMAWYATKGEQVFRDIQDYYRHLITNARKSGYEKGLNDARSGRNNSGSSVVSKRLKLSRENREQTIYDLD